MKLKRRRRLRRLWLALGLVLGVILFFVFYINANVGPVLKGLAGARVESLTARAMNEAISEVLRSHGEYSSIITIYSTDKQVYLLQADSTKLNLLAADCAKCALDKIAALGEQGVSIPIGTLSGVSLLAGVGPSLTMKFTPVGAVTSSFESEFRSAGINQTLHRISLKLCATVRLILPGQSATVTIDSMATIAENVIVGNVPNSYMSVERAEDLLRNLIPKTNP